MKLKALIFDVDGTIAETEFVHLKAFNQAFSDFKLNWQWDTPLYTKLLEVTGGKERLKFYFDKFAPTEVLQNLPVKDSCELDKLILKVHLHKNKIYNDLANSGTCPEMNFRPGILQIMQSALSQNIKLAIATTTSPENLPPLLTPVFGKNWQENFTTIENASTVIHKKPHPEAYINAINKLQLKARECLAFEDSALGLQSANSAGIPTIVSFNRFTEKNNFDKAIKVLPSFEGVSLEQLITWHKEC